MFIPNTLIDSKICYKSYFNSSLKDGHHTQIKDTPNVTGKEEKSQARIYVQN